MCGFQKFPMFLVELWVQLRDPCSLHQRSCHPCGRSQNWDAVALCATLLPSGVHLPAYETELVPQLCWMASPTQWAWVWASSGRWRREAWQAAVHGVAKIQTQLSDWTTTAIPLDSWYGCLNHPEGLGVTEEKTVSCVHLRTIPSPGRKHTHTQAPHRRFAHRHPHFLPFRPTSLPESTSTLWINPFPATVWDFY